MNAELKKLYDQKGTTWAQMQDVARKLKEGKELSTEENTQFDKWDGELKSITDKISKIERAEKLEAEMNAAKLDGQSGNGEQKSVNLGAFSSKERRNIWNLAEKRGVESLSKEEKEAYSAMQKENKAFSKFMIGLDLNEEERKIVKGLEVRAQSTSASAGGYTIPQGFIARVDRKLKMISPFFAEDFASATSEAENVFEFIRTDTGNTLPIPTNDDTSTTGELLAENTDAFANTADLTFAQVSFLAYKYNSKPMKVSNELLNDSGIDLENLVADVLATRIGRIVNTHFTTGTNSSQPQGIVTGATAGKTTAGATAITFPEVIDLVHSVDAAYRKSPSARFMLHDLILAYLKKQTIGSSTNDSRPLWQPSFQVGAPDTIDGFRYLVNNDMASTVATTNITMLFGDMKKYGIRQVNGYTVKRLNERFADYDQTAWLMFARFDGRYLNTSAIKKMTQA